jgi:hypothetical protein
MQGGDHLLFLSRGDAAEDVPVLDATSPKGMSSRARVAISSSRHGIGAVLGVARAACGDGGVGDG